MTGPRIIFPNPVGHNWSPGIRALDQAPLRMGVPAAIAEDGSAVTGPATPIINPPFVVPFSTAKYFYRAAQAVVVAAATTSDLGFFFTTPENNHGVVAAISVFVLAPTAAFRGTFALLFNGGAVEGFDQLAIFPQVSNGASLDLGDLNQQVPEKTKITMQFSNASATPFTVAAMMAGWYWPIHVETAVSGGVTY